MAERIVDRAPPYVDARDVAIGHDELYQHPEAAVRHRVPVEV